MYLRLGTDFLASLLTGLIIGYWLDRWIGTSPLFLIVFILLGFFAGCRTLFKVTKNAMDSSKGEEEKKTRGEKPPHA
jgi:ATP synthase protein I